MDSSAICFACGFKFVKVCQPRLIHPKISRLDIGFVVRIRRLVGARLQCGRQIDGKQPGSAPQDADEPGPCDENMFIRFVILSSSSMRGVMFTSSNLHKPCLTAVAFRPTSVPRPELSK